MHLLEIKVQLKAEGIVNTEIDKTLLKLKLSDEAAKLVESGVALFHLPGSPDDYKVTASEKLPIPAPLGFLLHETAIETLEIALVQE